MPWFQWVPRMSRRYSSVGVWGLATVFITVR
jgi:hypothetical protein